jgi:glycosyltransferase involved in cell wall biosynthesis
MLLSNGVDGTRFGPERRDAARRQGVGDDEVLAVYAGLHGVAQGLDQVVRAAAGLPADGDVRIVLVGDGPEKRGLVELAASLDAPAVRFADPIPYEEVPGLLASADVAIIPLREYLPGAVPSKLYEAMASAIPVVLVASGEAAQIVESADAGIVVAPGDVTGLRDALVALAADPERRARLGANGRRVVLERFDRRAICDAFIDELEAGIGGAR